MTVSQTLRFLSVPAALARGAALAVACSGGSPTAPDQLTPAFTERTLYADDDGSGACPSRYSPVNYDTQSGFSQYDTNQNGIYCIKFIGHKKK